jgi:hypothetical protein
MDPARSDAEIAGDVRGMFARPHPEGCDKGEFLDDGEPDPDFLVSFVHELRMLHFFG